MYSNLDMCLDMCLGCDMYFSLAVMHVYVHLEMYLVRRSCMYVVYVCWICVCICSLICSWICRWRCVWICI